MSHVGERKQSDRKWGGLSEPESIESIRQLGESLFHQGRYASALRCFEEIAATQREANPLVTYRMAMCCAHLNRTGEAQCYFRETLAQESIPQVHRDYAQYLLKNGRFDEGWAHYRRGRSADHFTVPMSLSAAQTLWDGIYRPDSTLEVVCESRISDQIAFAAFFPELLAQARAVGMRVVVSCHPTLTRLFQSSFAQATVIPWDLYGHQLRDQPIGRSDRRWMKARQSDLPGYVSHAQRSAYLKPDEEDVKRIGSIVAGNRGGLRVGLVSGGASGQGRDQRSEWGELSVVRAVLGCKRRWVRVFDVTAGQEGVRCDGEVSRRLGAELLDMSSIAALMEQMDVVVGVDSAEMNLSGALGCETRVLLREHADWRWAGEDGKCGWYPHVKGYRERAAGNGASPAERLLAELEGMSAATVCEQQQR